MDPSASRIRSTIPPADEDAVTRGGGCVIQPIVARTNKQNLGSDGFELLCNLMVVNIGVIERGQDCRRMEGASRLFSVNYYGDGLHYNDCDTRKRYFL